MGNMRRHTSCQTKVNKLSREQLLLDDTVKSRVNMRDHITFLELQLALLAEIKSDLGKSMRATIGIASFSNWDKYALIIAFIIIIQNNKPDGTKFQ